MRIIETMCAFSTLLGFDPWSAVRVKRHGLSLQLNKVENRCKCSCAVGETSERAKVGVANRCLDSAWE